jgi:glycosyltransferase involved in cell wall biosynthesis
VTLLSIVVPALNEESGIADIATRVLAVREPLAAVGIDGLELIVVDDGSSDRTAEIAAAIEGVTVVRHAHNRGYGAAIKTGFRAARGDLLAFLDADGTYPPESFPTLCSTLRRQGADIVVGSRMQDGANGMPRIRRIGNRFFAGLVSLVGGTAVSDSASGQRILRRTVLDRLYPLPDGLNFTPVMTTRAIHERLKVVEVPIAYRERVGRSKLSVLHDGRRFLATILWTALSYNPARVLGLLGLAAAGLALSIALWLVLLRLAGVTVLGPWGVTAAFAMLVLGVAGISLFNLGITFNVLVGLFHRRPVRQGLLGRPARLRLDRHFGWLGVTAIAGGVAVAAISLGLGLDGWGITRLWLWLLGSAMLLLVGLQLVISWVLMRVLEELSLRQARTAEDLNGAPAERLPIAAARPPARSASLGDSR